MRAVYAKLCRRRRAPGESARRSSPRRRAGALVGLAIFCATLGACEEEPELPPHKPDQATSLPTVGPQCAVTFRADRAITLGQLVLVLQRDPLDSNSLGFSLTTLRPGADGSRMIFGTFVRTDSVAGLTKSEIHLTSSSFLNPRGNGIFTGVAAYQPKLVTLRITSITEGEAEGTFSGDFYRFPTSRPAVRPEVIQANGTFTAALMMR